VITYFHHQAPGAGLHHHALGARDRVLLIMLPGVGSGAGAFAEHGMVAAVHARGLAVDVAAVHPDLELYLDGAMPAALYRTIVEPALAQGYARIWLLGISLGGMGALLYASAYTSHVEGLVLLAPFLGTRGTIAGMAKAGGLAAWSPAHSAATEPERRALVWLRDFLARRPARPALYLGYGREDRFAPGHRMLAEQLPEDDVITAGGGHDWATWLTLWKGVLDASPFTANAGGTGRCDVR
jgi:pimeloyl-ACP methyl ester carboxylesterase